MIINYSDEEVIKNRKSIFLAGPTPRDGNIASWRIEACKKLEEFGFDGVVYIPEYSSWKPKTNYNDQTMWERQALITATVILFWMPRELKNMPAFTSNVEFGYWLHSGKVIYGHPDNAVKVKYLDWLYEEDTKKKVIFNLDELLKESINMANILYTGVSYEILPLEKRIIMEIKK